MVEVICDTSFLIHLATRKIKNIDSVNTEIGQIQFVVPSVVLAELEKLSKNQEKKQDATATLEFTQNLKTIEISGTFVLSIRLFLSISLIYQSLIDHLDF